MRFSLLDRLRQLDIFGHPITVNYKGRAAHRSVLGACCSIIVFSATLTLMISAFQEVALMEDPRIQIYSRPMTEKDKSELGPVSFDEYGFFFAFSVTVFDSVGQIPPEVGRFTAWQFDGDLKQIPLASCAKVLPPQVLSYSGASFKSSVERGLALCLDPSRAKTA